jgi:hypothetical protein
MPSKLPVRETISCVFSPKQAQVSTVKVLGVTYEYSSPDFAVTFNLLLPSFVILQKRCRRDQY